LNFLSQREEQRFNKITEAIGKWRKIAASYYLPSLHVIAFLAGLRRVQKIEVENILQGGK
jgi:hypothetical protein